jgi:tetratricopeptide (TPR) repeat protein
MTARDLADRLRLDINHTSAQLNRLVKQGVVEKIRLPDNARTGFQLSERFFNIWYLMRASRRMRRRLMFLVRFLELFFQKPALRAQAQRRLRAMESPRDADYGFALAQVTDDLGLRHALETHSLRAALADPRTELGAILDLDGEDRALGSRAERIAALLEAERLVMAKQDWPDGLDGAGFWERLGACLSLSAREKLHAAMATPRLSEGQLVRLVELLDQWRDELVMRSSEALATAVSIATQKGYIDSDLGSDDIESVVAFAESQEIRSLLLALRSNCGLPVEREIFDSCIHETRSHWIRTQWATWASHVDQDTRLNTIRAADPGTICSVSLLDFSNLLGTFSRFEECELAIRQAIERDPDSASAWSQLGALLQDIDRNDEAETAYRRAIEIDSTVAFPWSQLGELLQDLSRNDEAEAAYRRAIEIDPTDADPWSGLGNLLQYHLSRYDEAEAASQRAATLAPNDPWILNSRAWLLLASNRELESAERAARTAVELEPNSLYFTYTLACVQAARGQWPSELARQLLTDEESQRELWDETMRFIAEVVRHGHTRDARALVQSLPNAEAWAPLIAALEMLEAGSAERLRALSPEMRAAVELALSRIAPDFGTIILTP